MDVKLRTHLLVKNVAHPPPRRHARAKLKAVQPREPDLLLNKINKGSEQHPDKKPYLQLAKQNYWPRV